MHAFQRDHVAIEAASLAFRPTAWPVYSGKCVLTFGKIGNRPVVVKRLRVRESFWIERFRCEIRWYRYFDHHAAPAPAPRLVAADDRQCILIITKALGQPLAGERYPESPIPEHQLAALFDVMKRLRDWRPHRPVNPRAVTEEYTSRLRRYSASGAFSLNPEEMALIHNIIRDTDWKPEFNHGDLLPGNCLMSRRRVTLIDWEFAGFYLPGYDLALLWILLANDAKSRERVEEEAGEAGGDHRLGFEINRLLLLGRECRIHAALEISEFRTRLLQQLSQDQKVVREHLFYSA